MNLDLSPARWVLFANGAVLVALALLVWTRRPRRRANTYFAVWATGLALAYAIYWILPTEDRNYPPIGYATAALLLVGAWGHAGLVLHAPRRLGRGDRRHLAWPLIALGAFVVIQVPMLLLVRLTDAIPLSADIEQWRSQTPSASAWADFVRVSAHLVYLGIAWSAAILLALRGHRVRGDTQGRRAYALFGAIVALFPAWMGGWFVFVADVAFDQVYAIFAFACTVATTALWLDATRHGDGSRACRNAALFIPTAFLSGMLYGAFIEPRIDLALGWALVASLEVILLVYAVLREQILGLELKLKWTINRGTLAAVFVASFFVVSELVAGILSERIGLVAGVLVTGALVFALAPLQRIADRVSDAAMPHVRDSEEYRTVRKREVYQAAVTSAMLDGVLTERERDLLATLADELGLRPSEARELDRAASSPD